jgi:hypothetical protein
MSDVGLGLLSHSRFGRPTESEHGALALRHLNWQPQRESIRMVDVERTHLPFSVEVATAKTCDRP